MKSLLLFVSLLSTSVLAQDKMSISLNWAPKQTYVQSLTMKQVVGVPRHGQATAETSLTMGLQVQQKKSGARSLGVSVDALKVFVDLPAPAANKSFDSTKPEDGNEEIATFYKDLQAQKPEMVLNARGKVTSVNGLDQLSSQNPVLSRFLGKEQMKHLMQQGWLAELPAKEVSPGDRWPFQMKFPTPVGHLLVNGNYILGDLLQRDGKSLRAIKLVGQVQGNFTQPSAEKPETDPEVLKIQAAMLLMGIKVKEGGMEGTLYYDPKLKLVTASEINTRIRLSVAKYPENGQPTEIPIDQEMRLELKEAK
jgi:hypothetical protein